MTLPAPPTVHFEGGFSLGRSISRTWLVTLISVLSSCQGSIGAPIPGTLDRDSHDVPDERARPSETPEAPSPTAPTEAEKPAHPSEPAAPEPTQSDPCDGPIEIAVAPLRRLTRTEYERSVEAVFGVTGATGAGLAADERIDGVFASNLSSAVAPVQVRQYLDAAESVSARVDLAALLGCEREQLDEPGCSGELIETVGRRVYRRPLSAVEVERYRTLYAGVKELEGHEPALRAIIQAQLQSSSFLYHVEESPPADVQPTDGSVRLGAYALAARLSFFLWSGPPDDALLDAAASGELDSADGLTGQARRLLADPRARHAIESFHAQWLGLGRLDTTSRDPVLFPEWSVELVSALRAETAAFSDHVIRHQHGDFEALLTATYSFPSGPGLAIRGVSAPAASDQPVELGERAAGLLTQPAFLAAHAHSNQTSPILRGRAIRERLFCQPLPDPPPNVAAVAPELEDGLTTRERYAKHRTAGSACFGCHSLIDDLGFALEHFDALGRWRDSEAGKPIDATGQLTSSDVDGAIDGARALAERMSDSTLVEACYAKQWFRYAVGRSDEPIDACAVAQLTAAFEGGGKIEDLLVAIANSPAFVRQKVEP